MKSWQGGLIGWEGGRDKADAGLVNLKIRKARAVQYVLRAADTKVDQ